MKLPLIVLFLLSLNLLTVFASPISTTSLHARAKHPKQPKQPPAPVAPKPPSLFEQYSPYLVNRLVKDLGIEPYQAAAIVGNLAHESAGFTATQEKADKDGSFKGGNSSPGLVSPFLRFLRDRSPHCFSTPTTGIWPMDRQVWHAWIGVHRFCKAQRTRDR